MDLEHYYDYDLLANDYFSKYERHFGRSKVEKIASKVDSSNAVERLIQDSIKARELPNQSTLSVVLLGTRHFMFANSDTLNFACFLTLNKTIGEFKSQKLYVSNDQALEITKRIMRARN